MTNAEIRFGVNCENGRPGSVECPTLFRWPWERHDTDTAGSEYFLISQSLSHGLSQ